MKIDKITPQIAALYLGQKCEYPNDNGGKIVCFLTGVASDGLETTYKKKRDGVCGDILAWEPNSPTQKRFARNILLHLRRMESITEEEAKEAYSLAGFKGIGNEAWNIVNYPDIAAETSIRELLIGCPIVWLYLLSKGFDLFGLIDSGLAKEIKP